MSLLANYEGLRHQIERLVRENEELKKLVRLIRENHELKSAIKTQAGGLGISGFSTGFGQMAATPQHQGNWSSLCQRRPCAPPSRWPLRPQSGPEWSSSPRGGLCPSWGPCSSAVGHNTQPLREGHRWLPKCHSLLNLCMQFGTDDPPLSGFTLGSVTHPLLRASPGPALHRQPAQHGPPSSTGLEAPAHSRAGPATPWHSAHSQPHVSD